MIKDGLSYLKLAKTLRPVLGYRNHNNNNKKKIVEKRTSLGALMKFKDLTLNGRKDWLIGHARAVVNK